MKFQDVPKETPFRVVGDDEILMIRYCVIDWCVTAYERSESGYRMYAVDDETECELVKI